MRGEIGRTVGYDRMSRALSAIALTLGTLPIMGALYLRLGGANPLGDCRFQQAFGFPAPSCGLTRSFIALVRGDWGSAIAYHLFGPLLFFGFVACAVQGFAELIMQRPLPCGYRWAVLNPKPTGLGLAAFALSFLAYHGVRLYARYQLVASNFDSAMIQRFVTGAHLL